MPRLRTIVAFVGGLLVAFLVGLVPAELITSLREWAGRPGPDRSDETAATTSSERIPSKQRRGFHPKGRGGSR